MFVVELPTLTPSQKIVTVVEVTTNRTTCTLVFAVCTGLNVIVVDVPAALVIPCQFPVEAVLVTST